MDLIKNLLVKIYNWEGLEDGYATFYSTYFQETWDFVFIFLAMLAITLAACIVFYLALGNLTRAFANIPAWVVMLLISCGLTFWSSKMIFYRDSGVENTHNGFPNSIRATLRFYSEKNVDMDSLNQNGTNLGEDIELGKEDILLNCAGVNAGYSIIMYFLFSLLLKRRSIHAKAIPW